MRITQNRLFLLVGLGVAGLMMLASGFGPLRVMLLLGLTYVLLRFATAPLSLLIARVGYSVRLKFEVAIGLVAALVLAVGLISFGAMDFMHQGLHDIQDIDPNHPFEVLSAVGELEDTQHGPLFTLMPVFSVLGVIVAATLGAAMAWSVIDPVRRMEGAMKRIASGDFAEPVEVVNRDELGGLALQINQTAVELARLQEETVADERSQALKERIAHVVMTQEEERRRISRELHDGLGPSLAAIGNRLRVCRSMVRTDPDDAESGLDEIAHGLTAHIQEIRTLIHDLRPVNLDQLGLVEALNRNTLQADALKLVAKKLQSSLAVEGELPEDGLAAYGDDGDDLMMALARKIVSGDEEEDAETMEEVFAQARDAEAASEEFLVDDGCSTNQTCSKPISSARTTCSVISLSRCCSAPGGAGRGTCTS